MANPTTNLAITHRDTIITRVAQGHRITDIAQSLGYSTHAAISRALAEDPDYKAARECGLEARLDAREAELETSDESVTVARAKELLSQARWRCEREAPHRWGAKMDHTVTVAPIMHITVSVPAPEPPAIDGETN